ncbi:MAG: NYN domain-containing protein [Dermatophilaceae bacterium]
MSDAPPWSGQAIGDGQGAERRLRSALFVDFDNVYIGLQRLDPPAAEAFANNPGQWLERLETGRDVEGEFRRRFLVRACYLNPSAFGEFRPFFTRAGFRVVDCPSLTQQGKSSADINMVLDAVDALSAPTRYDEFVILSADADFTPLALRCRAADRRVTIIAAGPAASAYRAVADTVMTADDLAEILTTPAKAGMEEAPLAVSQPGGTAGRRQQANPKVNVEPASTPPIPAAKAVLALLRSADGPVMGSSLAHTAKTADPTLPTSAWDGHGGFAAWLIASVADVGWSSRPSPGYGWDGRRFTKADLPVGDPVQPAPLSDVAPPAGDPVELTPLQQQVAGVTDIPPLNTEQYATLLKALAKDVNANTFHRAETSKRVRDSCQAAGVAIGRASISSVIQGLLYSAGIKLERPVTAKQLAVGWAGSVEGLCRGARMELSHESLAEVRAWVGGGLIKPAVSRGPAPSAKSSSRDTENT